MLSFKIGPVQPFIEAARTLRDLWSGSYLLSWLTAHGMKELFNGCDLKPGVTFITPHVDLATNALLRAVVAGEQGMPDATLACLPHTFAAEVPADMADGLRTAVVDAVNGKWKRIAGAVREALPEVMHSHFANWDAQIKSHFEITVVVRPNGATSPESDEWSVNEWDKLAELLDMTRSVRHVPAYAPTLDEKSRFPVKCSQLGSYEQIGPADFNQAKDYWAGLTRKGNSAGQSWDGLQGTGLQANDKLCEVALVKRFAWPAYLARKIGLDVRTLRFTDTATMAASKWLGEGELLDPLAVWQSERHWSGQWLHWATPDQDDDAVCPPSVWDRIQAKKRESKPPTYFALMHLDGDNMGGLFKGSRSDITGTTTRLTTFAAGVPDIVKQCGGELIYAGGDDVLAFLPTETAIACAHKLRETFQSALGEMATLSGGIAVVHYKEDLRFALGQVRAAEKKAKQIGKAHGDKGTKDALAVTVCKRSGEHSTVVLGWLEAKHIQDLVSAFKGGASDRWAYKLRAESETLKGLPLAAGKAEALRLVGRGENVSGDFQSVIRRLFDAYQQQMQSSARNWPDSEVLTGFVGLCQTASFLSRGKE